MFKRKLLSRLSSVSAFALLTSLFTLVVIPNAMAAPAAPTITSVTFYGSRNVTIGFTQPSGEAAASYLYNTQDSTQTLSTSNSDNWQFKSTTSSPIILTNTSANGNVQFALGTTYYISLRACNSSVASNSNETTENSNCSTASTIIVLKAGAPSAPTIDSITPGNATATVNFTAGDNGGSAITNYQYTTNGGTNWIALSPTQTTSPINITKLSTDGTTNLTNGTTYTVGLKAVNANGTSVASNYYTVTPSSVPDPPTSVNATPGNQQATVSWTAPASNGGLTITSYTVTAQEISRTCTSSSVPLATSCTVTGLVNGNSYTFKVTATNASGTSSASSASTAVTVGVPDAPTINSVTPKDSALDVAFTAGNANASAIYNYQYSTDNGVTWSTRSPISTTSPLTISGLTNGSTYTVVIRAVSTLGSGIQSNAVSAAIPSNIATAPKAPTITSITAGNTSLSINYTVGSNGGETITNYEYQLNGGSWVTPSPASTANPLVISGLVNGTPYAVVIRAVNSVGSGLLSNSVSGTPAGAPAAPTSLTATALTGSAYQNAGATLSWTAGSTGGSPIIGYQILSSTDNSTFTTLISNTGTTSTTYSVSGLNAGTYYFKVAAINSIGAGTNSSATTATVLTTRPGPPTITTITPSNGSLSIAFTAPTDNGGVTVTNYEYSTDNGSTWQVRSPAATTSPWSISNLSTDGTTGLTNGTAYTIQLRAYNSQGSGDPSIAQTATPNNTSTVPGVPTGLAATPSSGQVALSWSAPASNGGSAITDYTVQYRTVGAASWTTFTDAVSTSTSATVTGLTNGTSYEFQVSAVNSKGTGTASSSVTSTPAAAPAQVTGLTATKGVQSVSLSWTAPSANGSAITDYVVEYKTTSGGTWATYADGTSTSTSATVTGLTNGTSYDFRVSAVNDIGTGTASATASATPSANPPSAPTNLSASVGSGSITITFTEPSSNGGAAITNYKYSTDGTNYTAFSPAQSGSSVTISGLTNGTSYTIYLKATNSAGDSVASSSVTATPAAVPGTPTSLLATAGNGQISIAFTAGAANGSAITNYKYSTDGTNYTAFSPAQSTSPVVVSGLTNGTSYTIYLKATNGIGDSVASSSVTATPVTVPGAPTSLLATAGNGQISISFTAGSDGGATITNYKYSLNGGSYTALSPTDGTSPITITGLTNGTSYTITLKATNSAGDSVASSSVTATPSTIPGAPTGVSATATGSTTATISYTAPVSNGGSSITYYTATSSPGGITTTVYSSASGTISVTGLSHSTTYTFTVIAHNANGDSLSSDSSNSITTSVVKTSQTALSITSIEGTYGTTMTLTTTGGSSGETVTYAVTGTGTATGCQISGAVLSVTKAGTCLITATMPGNATYEPVSSSQTTYTVKKASRSISVSAPGAAKKAGTTITTADLSPTVTLEAGETLSIAVSTVDACSNASNAVSVNKGVGTCAVVVLVPASDNYEAATSAPVSISVDRADRTLSVTGHANSYSDWKTASAPTLSASDSLSTSDPKSFALGSGSTGCSVNSSSGLVTFTGAGTCKIDVTVGQTDVAVGDTKSISFTLGKANRSLSVSGHSASYTDWAVSPFDLSATLTDGDTDSKTYLTETDSVGCSVTSSGRVTITGGSGSGYCKITASASESTNYGSATKTIQFQIGRKSHSASLSSIINATVDAEQDLPTLSSEGQALTLTASPAEVCTISAGKVKGLAYGTCTVTASFTANNNYSEISTPKDITIGRGSRTITIDAAKYDASGYSNWGSTPPTLTSTLSADTSDTGKTYALDTGSKGCNVDSTSGEVTFTGGTGSGYCKIKVTAAQTSRYSEATSETIQFQIGNKSHSVSLSSLNNVSVDDEQTLPATSSQSQSLTLASSTPLVCTVSGGKVKAIAAGDCTVTAQFTSNDDYDGITESKTFVVAARGETSPPTTPSRREPNTSNTSNPSEPNKQINDSKNPVLSDPEKKPELAKVSDKPAIEPVKIDVPPATTGSPLQIVATKDGKTESAQLVIVSNTATVKGEDWNIAVVPATSSGKDAASALSGSNSNSTAISRIVFEPGLPARTAGTGFKPNSTISVYIFSEATFLGNLDTDENGNFDGSILIPAEFKIGDHTLQVNGLTLDNQIRSAAIGVTVAKLQNSLKFNVYFGMSGSWLNSSAYKTLRGNLKKIPVTAKSIKVNVIGFVEDTPNQIDPRVLGLARAKSVATGLKKLGLKAKYSVNSSESVLAQGAKSRRAEVNINWAP